MPRSRSGLTYCAAATVCASVIYGSPCSFAQSTPVETQAKRIIDCLDPGAHREAGIAGLRHSLEDCRKARTARYQKQVLVTPPSEEKSAKATEPGAAAAAAEGPVTKAAETGTPETKSAGTTTAEAEDAATSASTDAAVDAALATREKATPIVCLKKVDPKTGEEVDSDWCFTLAAFVGLTRVDFQSGGDRFQPLAGIATGVKLRNMYVNSDGVAHELVGFNLGLYYEPRTGSSATNAMTGTSSTTNVQTLSGLFTVSTFENFYLGAGYRFASEAADFRHADRHNIVFVFGLGVDGNSSTSAP